MTPSHVRLLLGQGPSTRGLVLPYAVLASQVPSVPRLSEGLPFRGGSFPGVLPRDLLTSGRILLSSGGLVRLP
jgi:hypothetical protein